MIVLQPMLSRLTVDRSIVAAPVQGKLTMMRELSGHELAALLKSMPLLDRSVES